MYEQLSHNYNKGREQSITMALVISPKSHGELGAELRAPKPDGLIAHRNTTLGQQILNTSMSQTA
jgi:hypothetical protein